MIISGNRKEKKFKIHEILWSLIASLILSIWLYYVGILNLPTILWDGGILFEIIVIFISLIILGSLWFGFPFDLISVFKKQKLHKLPSWIPYTNYILLLTPIIIIFIGFKEKKIIFETISLAKHVTLFIPGILCLFSTCFGKAINNKELRRMWRFAPGSVSKWGDRLDFRESAKNVSYLLNSLSEYVNVIGLYGGIGYGKSSFARMIIEQQCPSECLYTYISLTEANESYDFSKLFAERWFETLSQRYPKINCFPFISLLESVLRESGHSMFSMLLNHLVKFDFGLLPTKAACRDSRCCEISIVSKEVSRFFGNVTEIKERHWIIVIDEIERSEFDEIFHLIEIIERFKNIGRTGLPVKIIFMLCISRDDLQRFLDGFKDKIHKANLIEHFFFLDSKNVTHIIPIPSVNPMTMKTYIFNQISTIAKLYGEDLDYNISKIYKYNDPLKDFPNDQQAMKHLLDIFVDESPRMVKRCCDGVMFYLESTKNKMFGANYKIRISDIVLLEYIKMKYSYLVEVLSRIAYSVLSEDIFEKNRIIDKILGEAEDKNIQNAIINYIKDKTGLKIPEEDSKKVIWLIGRVARFVINALEKKDYTQYALTYPLSLSLPENFLTYVRLAKKDSEVTKNLENYSLHLNSKLNLNQLSDEDLYSYSHHLTLFKVNNEEVLLDLLQELTQRILNGNISRRLGASVFDSAIISIAFEIMHKIVDLCNLQNEESINIARNTFVNLMKGEKVPTGVKYVMIDAFITDHRSDLQTQNYYKVPFKTLIRNHENEIKVILGDVLKEAEKRYFSITPLKNIYENEENIQLILYQSWSGRSSELEEIERIRKAALNELEKYPEMIKEYWEVYTLPNREFGGEIFHPSLNSSQLYMPLEKLISVTKKSNISDENIGKKVQVWTERLKMDKYRDIFYKINNDTTIMSQLSDWLNSNG